MTASTLLAAGDVHARTFQRVKRVCPFTGTTFGAEIDASGTRFCLRLDFKPVGMIGSPPAVPVCPDDGFVVWKEHFSVDEVARLRPWVESEEFRQMTRNESTYYRIAQTLRKLGAPSDHVAWRLLQASWQVERDEQKYGRYVSELLRELEVVASGTAALGRAEKPALAPEDAAVLAGELERRTGRLSPARARLQELRRRPDLPEALVEIIDWELELVAAGDTAPHYRPREREESCRRYP